MRFKFNLSETNSIADLGSRLFKIGYKARQIIKYVRPREWPLPINKKKDAVRAGKLTSLLKSRLRK